jgi:hypothetical protein
MPSIGCTKKSSGITPRKTASNKAAETAPLPRSAGGVLPNPARGPREDLPLALFVRGWLDGDGAERQGGGMASKTAGEMDMLITEPPRAEPGLPEPTGALHPSTSLSVASETVAYDFRSGPKGGSSPLLAGR